MFRKKQLTISERKEERIEFKKGGVDSVLWIRNGGVGFISVKHFLDNLEEIDNQIEILNEIKTYIKAKNLKKVL